MHAAVLGADDAGVIAQTRLVDDQRPIEEDLDGGKIDHGNGVGAQRRGAHQRLEPDGAFASRGSAAGSGPGDRFAQPQARLGARSVKVNDVARINQVGVADLLAVKLPDLGPQPGRLQEPGGNVPECVALDDDMLVGRIRRKLDRTGCSVGDAGSKPDRASDQPHAKLFDHFDAAWTWFGLVVLSFPDRELQRSFEKPA